ncbi:hypothetical protein [Streptomyces sp. NPDC054794]
MNTRRMIALAAAASAAAGVLLVPATPAAATATYCRDHLKSINGTDPNGHWPPYSSTYTTSYCNDINVKVNQQTEVETCFAPSSGGYYCNGFRTLYANTWGLAATDVRDGTNFWLIFGSTTVQGVAAY